MLKMPDPAGLTDRERGYELRQFTADQLKAAYRQGVEDSAASIERHRVNGPLDVVLNALATDVRYLLNDTDARKGE